jgi:hypothetical protein
LIVWEKEETEWSVSVREYKTKAQYTTSSDEFTNKIAQEYRNRI